LNRSTTGKRSISGYSGSTRKTSFNTLILYPSQLVAAIVHPGDVRLAVMKATANIIVVNHPSGDTKPSQEDILLTTRLSQAGEILGINVLDHVIIGSEGNYFSFRDNGMLRKS
jgi:DNA repair protein RadC